MANFNYFRNNVVAEIIKTIKENPSIQYNKLVNKLGVNPPFIKKETAEKILSSLIMDEQVIVNSKGETTLC